MVGMRHEKLGITSLNNKTGRIFGPDMVDLNAKKWNLLSLGQLYPVILLFFFLPSRMVG